MPLETSSSKEAFKHNIEVERTAKKPEAQAVEIAFAKQREAKDAVSAAGIMYKFGDEVLMMKRAPGSSQGGTWAFPAGKMEPGETPEQCAFREFQEETGRDFRNALIKISESDGFVLYSTSGPKFDPQLNEEHTEFKWVKLGELPQPLHPGVMRAFEMHGMDEASARRFDENGWFEVRRNPISRVGVFPYLGKSVDPSFEPDQIVMVYRPAEELSSPDTINSFKLVPWVDMHPAVLLGPEETGRMPAEQKGVEGVTGEDVFFEGDTLFANIKIFSDSLGKKIDGGVSELSLGYGCKYELSSGVFNGMHYDAIQRNIRGNHLATVSEGRMGPEIAVLDHLRFTFDAREIMETKEEGAGENEMSLDDVMGWMKENGPKMKKMQDMVEKHFGKAVDLAQMPETEPDAAAAISRDAKSKDASEEKKEEEKKSEDESEEEKKDDKKAEDEDEEKKESKKEAADEEPEEKKAAKDNRGRDSNKGMDAAIARVKTLESEMASFKKNGMKSLMQEISRRNELAERISSFTGAFDHSEMTITEVASYGVKKLGLKPPVGHEMTALDGYFVGRKPASSEVGFALDASNTNTVSNTKDVTDFYSKSA